MVVGLGAAHYDRQSVLDGGLVLIDILFHQLGEYLLHLIHALAVLAVAVVVLVDRQQRARHIFALRCSIFVDLARV